MAPLDWGLGHATRCIPFIQHCLSRNIRVQLAGNGHSLQLLKKEFPDLNFSELPGYDIKYTKNPNYLGLKIALQSTRLFMVIRKEHQAINKLVNEVKVDMILSDNRYGCYHSDVHSVFLGHQLRMRLPKSLAWVNRLNKRLIRNFDECWVPDYEYENELSGELSHHVKGINAKFIGPMSRFHDQRQQSDIKYKYLAILSGPEPQRSVLNQILQSKFSTIDSRTAIVQGDLNVNTSSQSQNTTIFSHLGSDQLAGLINESERVVCRAGYSSIMDMIALNKKAYIIPTPGQSEQEYLANHLDGKYGLTKISQSDLAHFQFED